MTGYDPRQIANQAQGFLLAAVRCHERRPDPGSSTQMQTLTVAGVVCSAFAAELALKAILTVEGRRPTGPEHNLEKLFDAVSPTVRDRIYPLMSLSADEFMVKFRPCAKAFEGWRYIYESAEGYIDYDFLHAAANAFFATAMTLLDSSAGSV
jgi:hypothetical protein